MKSDRNRPSTVPRSLGLACNTGAINLSEPELQAMMIGVDLARLIPPRPAWMLHAACREQRDVDFFPGRGGNARPALALCRGCSVRETCLTYGQENGEHGVWGSQLLKRSERRGPRRRKADVEALGAQAPSPDDPRLARPKRAG